MVTKADVAKAILDSPEEAAAALLAIQPGVSAPVSIEALRPVAVLRNRRVEDVVADEIERLNLTEAFALALQARGVVTDPPDAGYEDTQFDDDLLLKFLPRAKAFRCQVLVNDTPVGSGCLISPSIVLTSWHVVATAWPDELNSPRQIKVLLSDNTKRKAWVLPKSASPCTESEFQGKLPLQDALFKGYNDIVLLRLDRPEGVRLGFAGLPDQSPPMRSRSAFILIHYPSGTYRGVVFGKVWKYREMTARWKHSEKTDPGSSGGPCFNTRFGLAGLHQGRWKPDGRLVPVDRFLDSIRPEIENDIIPPALWSLDGTINGQMVVGRDLFFQAVSAAAHPASRVRGVRVKRLDVAQGNAGLAFSLEMLTKTLARNPGVHRTIRISFEPPYTDLIDDITRRAIAAGFNIPAVAAGAGVRAGETTLEAALNDRARTLAAQLDAAAAEGAGQLIWLLFDNPPAGLSDAERFALEAFLGAALKLPQLRLVIAGFETVPTPGEEFATAGVFNVEGAPGLVVEYFGLFNRGDVEKLLDRACQDLGLTVDQSVVANRTNEILLGIAALNGQYSAADLKTVGERASLQLATLQQTAGAQP